MTLAGVVERATEEQDIHDIRVTCLLERIVNISCILSNTYIKD